LTKRSINSILNQTKGGVSMNQAIGKYFAVDFEKKTFKTPNAFFGKTYKFEQLKQFRMVAGGNTVDVELLFEKADSEKDFLNWYSFTSLSVEFQLTTDEEMHRIVFFRTPFEASERNRLVYAKQAVEIISMMNKIMGINKGEE
jgi:hypothetical protein